MKTVRRYSPYTADEMKRRRVAGRCYVTYMVMEFINVCSKATELSSSYRDVTRDLTNLSCRSEKRSIFYNEDWNSTYGWHGPFFKLLSSKFSLRKINLTRRPRIFESKGKCRKQCREDFKINQEIINTKRTFDVLSNKQKKIISFV